MCYHTTFLFSLCGHISVSPDPVRNTPKCDNTGAVLKQDQELSKANLEQTGDARPNGDHTIQAPPATRATRGRSSYHSITSPFPSPQEFEFVRQAHDVSSPASPTSPTIIRRLTGRDSRPQSGYGDDTLASFANDSTVQPVSRDSTTEHEDTPTCLIIARHPLHTYILPALCLTCRSDRERNIAKFEHQIMKESLDREQWGYRRGAGPQGVIDAQRKRIHRRSAGKCKLIPLICVEENRMAKQVMQEQAMEIMSQQQSLNSETVADQKMSEYSHLNQSQIDADGDDRSTGGASVESKQSRYSTAQSTPTKIAGNTLASWGRSWWNKSTASASTSTAGSQPPTPLPSMLSHPQLKSSEGRGPPDSSIHGNAEEEEKQLKDHVGEDMSTNLDWSETKETWKRISSEVKRDVYGRDSSAMSRIMAFDTNAPNVKNENSGVRL